MQEGDVQEPLGASQGRVTLGVYRVRRGEAEARWREQGCGGQLEKHTGKTAHVGKPILAVQAREGDAIPMGTGHPVRPALVTPAPLSLL